MKKLISLTMAIIMLTSMATVAITSASAETTVTFNGKKAVKGEIVYATYAMKAPKVIEDIQAYAMFSSGLQLISVSFSDKMKTGSFFYKIHPDRVNFNSVCIMEPMDFTKSTNIITMKFKVTGSGKLSTSFVLEVMDSVDGTNYGKNQTDSHYNELEFQNKTRMMVYSVNLNKTSIRVKVGRTKQLYETITPSSASNKAVLWYSSNKSIATVNSKGLVSGKKEGSCYITCKAKDGSGKTINCVVTVYRTVTKATQKITAKSYTKTYGSKAFSLGARSSGNGKLTYSSSDKKVATVSSKGIVTVKGCGKTTITIKVSTTSKYKSASKKITITVKPAKLKITGYKGSKLKFTPQANVSGYEVKIAKVGSKFKKNLKLSGKSKYLDLKKYSKGDYKIQIRAYKKVSKSTYYGAWGKCQLTLR